MVANREIAYRIFKYAIYGAYDDGKKPKPRQGPNRKKAKAKKVKK